MTRRFAAFVLALAAVGLTGCEQVRDTMDQAASFQPAAVGPIPEIVVVTDSSTWAGPVGEALRAELAQPIVTLPNQQGAFKLVVEPLDGRNLNRLRSRRALFFAAAIDAPSPTGEFMRARLDPASQDAIRAGQGAAVNVREDLWAAGQAVVIATAQTEQELARTILQRGDSLRALFNRVALANTRQDMFDRARQVEKEAQMMERHGFAVNVQHDYIWATDTTATVEGRTGTFVRLRRILSNTWRDFFVFAQDDATEVPPLPDLDRMTDGLLERFARGVLDSSYVQTDPLRPFVTDTISVNGRRVVETRGLWYMTNDLMGGSYIRHAFVADNRLFVYYGMTFAPDRTLDKREFLRQMEVIAHTFRTRSAAEAPRS